MNRCSKAVDEEINNLAVDWFFMNLHCCFHPEMHQGYVNEWLEIGIKLKVELINKEHTLFHPLPAYLSEEKIINIWINSDLEIQTDELSCTINYR